MNESAERDHLIALSLLPFLTPNRTRLLLEYFDRVADSCNAASTLLQGLLSVTAEEAAQVRNPLTKDARERVASLRDSVITLRDEHYPPLLREICDPPLVLHVDGDRSLLTQPSLAVVGSRRASPYGLNAASHLTRSLATAGLVIVSGLARGIDAAAHAAAIDSGGRTIAVLGTGIDVVYPRSNGRLFREIRQNGLLVSEFPPGSPPKPEHFPIRNRVISGLSLGTLIVEATRRSGSLITARMAAEQGREVFAVPGSIFSAGSEGTHRLAQYGAKLVHDAGDVLEELPVSLHLGEASREEPPPELKGVLDALSRDEATHIDTLHARLGNTRVAESLLQLEIEGWIKAVPGARYVRVK